MTTHRIIYPPLPIDYGSAVEWTDEALGVRVGSVYAFSGLDENGTPSTALVELPNGDSVEVALINVKLIA